MLSGAGATSPAVSKWCGVTAAGAAAHWLPLLSPGRSIEQIRAGRTTRERALQTPITPKLINVFLNKHDGSASNSAEAAAEVSRGRRSNSSARGDGVGRIPKQENNCSIRAQAGESGSSLQRTARGPRSPSIPQGCGSIVLEKNRERGRKGGKCTAAARSALLGRSRQRDAEPNLPERM